MNLWEALVEDEAWVAGRFSVAYAWTKDEKGLILLGTRVIGRKLVKVTRLGPGWKTERVTMLDDVAGLGWKAGEVNQ